MRTIFSAQGKLSRQKTRVDKASCLRNKAFAF